MSSGSNKEIIDSKKGKSLNNTTMSKRQTEEFCLSLVESTSDSMYLVDENCRYLFINSQHLSRMGMPSADIIGRSYQEFHSPEQTEVFVEKVNQVFKRGKSVQQEHHSKRDGRYFLRTFSPIKDVSPNGQIVRVAVVSKDITERKKAEETLRTEMRFINNLIQASPAFFVAIGADGKIIMMNDSFLSALGYSHEQVVGKDYLSTLVPERDHDLLSAIFEKLAISHEPSLNENHVLTRDGRELLVEWHGRPVFDDKENFLYFFGVGIDITERKLAEDALLDGEARYRSILENILDVYYRSDKHGNLIMLSPSGEALLGYDSVDELIGKSISDTLYFNPEDRKYFVSVLRKKGSVRDFELTLKRKDGTPIPVSTSSRYYYDEKGDILGIEGIIRDITERKLAEETLREREARYKLITDNMTDTLWLMDMNLKTTWCSPSVMRSRGYSLEEINALPMEGHVIPESIEIILKTLSEELTPERLQQKDLNISRELELEFYKKDGATCWSEVRVILLRDPQGSPIGLLGVGRDITERKRVQEALRESEERYRYLIKHAPAGIYEADYTTGRFLSVNDAMCQYTGYTREEFLSLDPIQLLTSESQKSSIQRHAKVLAGEPVPASIEFQIKRKDGTEFWVILNSRYSYQPDNRILSTVIAHDITERKKAEQALLDSKEQYQFVVENLKEVVFRTDAEGHWTFLNSAWAEVTGFAVEESLGKVFLEYVYPEDRQLNLKHFRPLIERKKDYCRHEIRYMNNDGGFRWIEVWARLTLDEKGNATGTAGTLTDITDRKRAEDQRREMEERLQRAEKMEVIGLLAGGVAHDLNNVLGAIIGYSELLLMDADKSKSISPGLMKIMNGGQKAAAIVQDLLTLARRGVPGREVLNLNKIIADCQKSPEFEKLSSFHPSVKIKTYLEQDLLNVSGSSMHLGKTLFNLVSNASEAMPKGGIVTIKTANQYLEKLVHGYDEVREGDYVVLSVSDTGEGIPAADLKHIFEPFYTKKIMGRSGTGLGLAVVWGTVKDHKGYINVESKEGKGSTFTLYFPVTREDVTAEAAAVSMSEYMGKGESILIVDDVKDQCDLAAGMLQKLNYNVSGVSSGEEAVEYLKEHEIDLIVLDMIMDPGIDGLDTYKKVLEVHPKQKAIIVSGFSETERVTAAQTLGAGAYVRKPYVIEKLGLAVRTELDRK